MREWLRTEPGRRGSGPHGYVLLGGVSVFYLALVEVAETQDVESIEGLVEYVELYSALEDSRQVAERILETYRSTCDNHA